MSFDDQLDRLLEVTDVGPHARSRRARDAPQAAAVLAGTGLDPRGATGIGAAVVEGQDVLADGQAVANPAYDELAIVVLTDGNENQTPKVADGPTEASRRRPSPSASAPPTASARRP